MSDSKPVASMSMWCNVCPASIQGVSVAEALEWNRTHDAMCPGAPVPPAPRERTPADEVRFGS